jgi:hypothetical protein
VSQLPRVLLEAFAGALERVRSFQVTGAGIDTRRSAVTAHTGGNDPVSTRMIRGRTMGPSSTTKVRADIWSPGEETVEGKVPHSRHFQGAAPEARQAKLIWSKGGRPADPHSRILGLASRRR